MVVSLLILWCC